jgi:regulator of chromosome condensation
VFGSGDSAELGLGDAKNVKRPRLNKMLDAATVGVVQIAVGGMHCVALTHDHKILTWGVNDNYALGRDTTWEAPTKDADADSSDDEEESDLNPRESNPTAIPTDAFESDTRFAQVVATNSASFALTTEGLVYGWGTFMVSFSDGFM